MGVEKKCALVPKSLLFDTPQSKYIGHEVYFFTEVKIWLLCTSTSLLYDA